MADQREDQMDDRLIERTRRARLLQSLLEEPKDGSPPRRHGSISCCDGKKVYIIGGSPVYDSKHIYILDLTTRKWTKQMTTYSDTVPQGLTSHVTRARIEVGTSCVAINDYIYIFGGWFRGILNNDVHQLDLNEFCWRWVEPTSDQNQPLLKNKQGMVVYNSDCLLIFGGYGYPAFGSPYQPGADYEAEDDLMWTNEIHLFDLKDRVWKVPKISGTPPRPCAAFSFNYIDKNRVLLFGGRQKPERVNEVHILDTATWHWSGALLPTSPLEPWPVGRSFHTACTLVDPELVTMNDTIETNRGIIYCKQHLLVLWGNDKNGDILSDNWILEIKGNTLTWKQLTLPKATTPRTWHTSVSIYDSHYSQETIVFTFGGSRISFFNNPLNPDHVGQLDFLMRFGCSSLYRLSQRALLSFYNDNLEVVKSVLPLHIYKELDELKTIESRLETVNCSI